VPVLLQPVLERLNIREDGTYIDGTFGRGGHSREICGRLGPAGRLLAIDRDPQAVAAAEAAMREKTGFEIVKGEIANIRDIAARRKLLGKVDGILFDLGVSSPQLDDPSRGFSFRVDGPLDMRMDPASGVGALEWLAQVEERDLKRVLAEFGEERFAGRIARAIVSARGQAPLTRTSQLARIVADAVPKSALRRGEQRKHPATKTFQAVRIQVNDELRQVEQALAATAEVLARGGRQSVNTIHTQEDRINKRFMRNASREAEAWRGLPSVPEEARPPFRIVGKAVTATAREIDSNPRARSARLRTAERI
jgi:16S rRNA (cytosine1402-N4)-methyltransferase